MDPANGCQKILSLLTIPKETWQVGTTKIFMKNNVEIEMEKLRGEKIAVYVIRIQGAFKVLLAKAILRKSLAAIICLQKCEF